MGEHDEERVYHGVAAAGGLAFGTVVRADRRATAKRQAGSPAEEAQALRDAIARAGADLDALIAGEDELAAEILEFQRALLADEDLVAPIVETVNGGTPADAAWAAALDREIAEYRSGDDEYFQARADDLADLKARVLAALHPEDKTAAATVEGGLYVAEDLTPSRFLELDWSRFKGAALKGGSRTSHVAILARARGIPLVVGLQGLENGQTDGAAAVLDAEDGRLILSPRPATLARMQERAEALAAIERDAARLLDQPARTADGDAVTVMINVDEPGILSDVAVSHCDGVGLTRTEFLFRDGVLPDEEAQLATYTKILDWTGGKPVTIRTLDAGGDKPIPGVTDDSDPNPFMGLRGLRLSLARPAIFRVQLRALARAAAHGPLKVMVPMVTTPAEIERVRALFDEVIADLETDGLPHAQPALGMMVEVPAAALQAAAFDVAFYSIGSNDLVQYATAAARDNPAVAALADPRNPAVGRLIGDVVAAGHARGVEVSLCGDMASDPALVPALLDTGLRCLSVAPATLGRVKAAIASYRRNGATA